MRLEVVGRQLEAWEIPLGSSWRCLDALLEASWKLPEPPWMPLASRRGLLGALGIDLRSKILGPKNLRFEEDKRLTTKESKRLGSNTPQGTAN